jgi:hypothetical protein
MARARVYSEVTRLKTKAGTKVFRTWGFRVYGWNGMVLTDDGYGTADAAIEDASRLVAAVRLIEGRGHKLKPWQTLVDRASKF